MESEHVKRHHPFGIMGGEKAQLHVEMVCLLVRGQWLCICCCVSNLFVILVSSSILFYPTTRHSFGLCQGFHLSYMNPSLSTSIYDTRLFKINLS